jgi:hypothetical protein
MAPILFLEIFFLPFSFNAKKIRLSLLIFEILSDIIILTPKNYRSIKHFQIIKNTTNLRFSIQNYLFFNNQYLR